MGTRTWELFLDFPAESVIKLDCLRANRPLTFFIAFQVKSL